MPDAEPVMRRFLHEPLKSSRHIRLLQVKSDGHSADDISVELTQFPLESTATPRYQALSYVWGSAEQPRTILCNQQSLNVTKNLFQALRHLHYLSNPVKRRFLWIDAICINQEDLSERSTQVQLMGQIYSKAESVICWLGEEQVPLKQRRYDLPPSSHTSWSTQNDLLHLLSRPFFQRAWILQEVLLSSRRSVNFDFTELEWDSFWEKAIPSEAELLSEAKLMRPIDRAKLRRALQFYTLTSYTSAIHLVLRDPIVARTNRTLLADAWQEFSQLTKFAKELLAADARDMVYCWMGIASALGIPMPSPDYTKSAEATVNEAVVAVLGSHMHSGHKSMRKTQMIYNDFPLESAINLPHRRLTGILLHLDSMSPTIPVNHALITKIPQQLDSSESDADYDSDYENEFGGELDVQGQWRGALKDMINDQKRELLALLYILVQKFQSTNRGTSLLARFREYLTLCQNGSGKSDRGTNSKGSGSQKKQKICSSTVGVFRGHLSGTNDKDESNENDGLEERPRKQPNGLEKEDARPKYACPYFQRNSQSPHLHRACRGPGFPDMHRLKWHLYRVHYINQCERCGQVFESKLMLSSHRLAPAQMICELTAWAVTFDRDQGFAEAQKIRLKDVKSHDFWNAIFSILFPEDFESSYPPQYHMDTQFMQFSHQFQDYWNQRSQDIVLHRLEHTSLNNLVVAQFQNMRDHLVQLVNEISIDVINSFQHHVARVNQGHGISGAPHPSVAEGSLKLVASNDQAHSADAQGPLAISSNPSVAPPHPSESLAELFEFMRTQANDVTWAPPMSGFAGFEPQQLNLDDGNGEHGNYGGAAGDDAAKPPESTFPSEQFTSDLSPGDDWDLVSRFK